MPLHGMHAREGRFIVAHGGRLLETGETADTYHVEDDGDLEKGLDVNRDVQAIGATSNVDVPHYANNGIDFAATTPGTINDAGAGFASILTGDTIVVRGSDLNDGVYTVSTGGVAGVIRTTEATVLEAAGDYVSIAKRAALSNNVVYDWVTGLMWTRYTSDTLKVGVLSDGELAWNDAALHFDLHGAAADLAMVMPGNIIRIVGGAAEIGFYTVGDIVTCSGFANAVNNYTGYVIAAVAVNGADLDITLDPSNHTLIAEAAGGARDIKLCCQSAFGYCAGANRAGLGGYTGWRVPNITEMHSLLDFSLNPVTPNVATFPSWPDGHVWTSTTDPSTTANAYATTPTDGTFTSTVKTATENVGLVRLV